MTSYKEDQGGVTGGCLGPVFTGRAGTHKNLLSLKLNELNGRTGYGALRQVGSSDLGMCPPTCTELQGHRLVSRGTGRDGKALPCAPFVYSPSADSWRHLTRKKDQRRPFTFDEVLLLKHKGY